MNAGSYKVTEGPHAGYAVSFSSDCTSTIKVGEVKTCTVTNNDIPRTCVLSQGGCKAKSAFWPTPYPTLGGKTYTKAQLLAILNLSSTGDASVILAVQLLSAKLNIAALGGVSSSTVNTAVATGDSLLNGFAGNLPYKVKTNSTIGKKMVSVAETLEKFNLGHLGTGACK